MRFSKILLSACVGLAALATSVQAQVVPFYVEGSFVGNLITLEAYGQAIGSHFGRCTFVVTNDANTGLAYDTYTASDGSTLTMVRVGIEVEYTHAGGNFVYIRGLDYWQIVGGTGRFANARSAGDPIVSTFFTPEPVDLVNGDLTAIPAEYFKEGRMDLGRRR